MYRITIYKNDGEKTVDEFEDEDIMRDIIDNAINDIERKSIKTFSVSWLSTNRFTPEKPFWEKK